MNTESTRPFYWSLRREVWENRSIYLAPLATATVFLLGFAIGLIHHAHRMRGLSALDPAKQRATLIMPYSMAAALIMFTAFAVAVFYCLDALYGERRDRSILFWKSLPVSDRTAVLSKACVAVAVIPLLTSAIVYATQMIMLPLHTAVLAATGVGGGKLWRELPFVQMALIQVYGLAVHALWHAPLYGWLLLVSAWARRTPFLWAVLPPVLIGGFERIAFGTSHFGSLLAYRVMGAMKEAFTVEAARTGHVTLLTQLDAGRFLTSGGLWSGLLFAALFLAAATRLRRRRGPL
jgi:ABC-2 type transport system permease protein